MPPKSRNSIEQEGRILLDISAIKNDKFAIFVKQPVFIICPVLHSNGD